MTAPALKQDYFKNGETIEMSKLVDLTDKVFGRLTVIKRAGTDKGGQALWLCKCLCGQEKTVLGNSLRVGTKSCGCINLDRLRLRNPSVLRIIDQTGQRFGRLTVIERAEKDKYGNTRYLCRCECGVTKTVRAGSLRAGTTKSCTCLRYETAAVTGGKIKHGHSRRIGPRSPENIVWRSMLTRSRNPNATGYANYGGRGITVCDRWQGEQGFQSFLLDMGPRPAGTSLDRINPNGNYELRSATGELQCRWASRTVQGHNKRKRKNCSSRFRGVTRQKNTEKFLAAIKNGDKSLHLGTFDSEIDAAIAYNEAAKIHFGTFANLNEIPVVTVN